MPSRLRALVQGALVLSALAGCATTPEPAPAATALACPAPSSAALATEAANPVRPADAAGRQGESRAFDAITIESISADRAPPAPEPYRGRLAPASWLSLPGWAEEPMGEALATFRQSCVVLQSQPAWQGVCAAAAAVPDDAADRDIAQFFESRFAPHQVINADETDTGTITGYYEPLLRGSRTRNNRFRYPVYGLPPDLVVVDLSSLHPDLRHKRLRGRLEGNRLVPYHSRGEIDAEQSPLRGQEIAWVDDPVELFFLHIQGSGQIQLENGERVRIGYAEQNGHPFRSVASLLIRRGELPAERTSLEGMRDWARKHPTRARQYLNANPSFVFFRELPRDLTGPLGTLGVPLTSARSLAVDPRVIPLGVPVFLDATWPATRQPLRRLMVAQDTGGAIAGAVRADFYWGFGDEAGRIAGRTRQQGRMWVLLPKGYTPPATWASGAGT